MGGSTKSWILVWRSFMEVFLVFADEWGEENDGSGVEAFVFFFFSGNG